MTPPIDSRLRVLLIEDNDGDAELVNDYLEEAGQGQFDVNRSKTLQQGIARIGQWEPQVILLDLNLPDSKGMDTLNAVGALGTKEKPRPPIVVLTSLDDQETAERAIAGYAQDYLVKNDVNARVLLRAIRFAVQRHGKTEVDRMLDEPTKAVDNSREAMRVLQRTNRIITDGATAAIPRGIGYAPDPADTSLLPHFATVAKISEVVLNALDQRVVRLEGVAREYDIAHAREGVTIAQIERILVGNGKGPLATRLIRMEQAVDSWMDDRKERDNSGRQIRIGIIVLAVGWFGNAVAWFLTWRFGR